MTSFPFAALIVIASVQTPSSTPAPPEDAIPVRVTLGNEASPETAVRMQPFQKLFTQSKDELSQEELAHRSLEAQKQFADPNAPKIVCGMVVIPGNPTIDPKMIQRRSAAPSTTFHIRRIPPTTCAEQVQIASELANREPANPRPR